MITDYDPRYKLLRLLVKEEFIKEGLDVPDRILPPFALPNSDPRLCFLLRVTSILLNLCCELQRQYKKDPQEYNNLSYLYDKYRNELNDIKYKNKIKMIYGVCE